MAPPILRTVAGLWSLAFVGLGLVAMACLSPRVPYADPWRFVDRFLSEPFWSAALAADNGHREVLPNLLRLAELHWCDGNQLLQIGAGLLLALATVGLVVRIARSLPAERRLAALLAMSACIFWLGNGRKLAHANESVHLFLVLLSLLVGLRALASAEPQRCAPGLVAAAAALVATFSFGSGVACFPAFAMVLLLRRAPFRHWWPLGLAALVAVPSLLLGGDDALPRHWSLLGCLDLLLRWLGAPFVWMLSPLLDPAHAARLPGEWLPAIAGAIAAPVQELCGPPLAARWPSLAFGGLGFALLLHRTWRQWRVGGPALEPLALGVAWFAIAVGGMVVGLRVEYFDTYPLQVTTQRYLPWSMLLWAGLLLAHVARASSARRALWPVLAFALLLTPSSVWTTRYAWKLRETAELTALGATVGVLATDFSLEETVAEELRAAVPKLRAAGKVMFAWPETAWLGRQLPAERAEGAALTDVVVRPVENRLGAAGRAVTFRADAVATDRLLLLAADRTVLGLALRLPFEPGWSGWLRGEGSAGAFTAAALR